jgi:hypothetical protein
VVPLVLGWLVCSVVLLRFTAWGGISMAVAIEAFVNVEVDVAMTAVKSNYAAQFVPSLC